MSEVPLQGLRLTERARAFPGEQLPTRFSTAFGPLVASLESHTEDRRGGLPSAQQHPGFHNFTKP